MIYKKILTGVLSKTLNLSNGEVEDLLNNAESNSEEVEAKILEKDLSRITNLKKTSEKESFSQGFQKAKSEVLTDFEKNIKTRYKLDSDKQGIELIDSIISENLNKNKIDLNSEEEIKKSKAFQDMLLQKEEQINSIKNDFENKINELKNIQKAEQTKALIASKANELLNKFNLVIPENTVIADNLKKSMLDNVLSKYNFELQDDRILVLNKENKLIQDQFGNQIKFDKIIEETSKGFFEERKSSGAGSLGNNEEEKNRLRIGENGYPVGITPPKNQKELSNLLNDSSLSLKDKIKIAEAFGKEKEHN